MAASSALQHRELMSEGDDFCVQRSASLEGSSERENDRAYQGIHDPSNLRAWSSNFYGFNINGVFSRDNRQIPVVQDYPAKALSGACLKISLSQCC